MTGWLLDTNVLSELRRPKPQPKVVEFVASQPLAALHHGLTIVSRDTNEYELANAPVLNPRNAKA